MAEALEETAERLASAIMQKCRNFLEERSEELFQDWMRKIGLLERITTDFIPERVQTETEEVPEVYISGSGSEKLFDKLFQGWMVQTELLQRMNFEGEQPEIEDWEVMEVSASGKGEAKSDAAQKTQMEKGIFLRKDFAWQMEKLYNIDFWIFGQNQLSRDTAIFLFGVKIRNVLQIEKAGGLFLLKVRWRTGGIIVRKGMG